ncbi:MAG TPA: histidine kinase dimerization/phosphoacceptor domain -containing protein [Acetobacteraceae bacterium]
MTIASDRSRSLLAEQTALAQFGEFALRSEDLDDILHEACRLIGSALGTDLAKVMEVQEDGKTLLIRAGVGWQPGVVGEVTVRADERTSEGLALATGEPIICSDIRRENRFDLPGFMKDRGVQAFVNVNIISADSQPPYGILQVDSLKPREFSEADIQFLRNYANLVTAAVERLRMLSELRNRAAEKERLLMELQHRVKNNLQVIMNLVSLRLRRTRHPEAANELRAVGDGIEALRLVHEKIHSAHQGTDETCLGTYLGELGASLLRFHGDEVSARIRLVAEVEQLHVTPDIAVPFGLITSEFFTNSLKYAFGGEQGAIGVRVERAAPDRLRVTLWDNGQGLPEDRSGGSGMRLVEGLARQVGATAQWSSNDGTQLVLTMPLRPAES